jgi:hypothetical protein
MRLFNRNNNKGNGNDAWANINIDPVPNRGVVGKAIDWLRDIYTSTIIDTVIVIAAIAVSIVVMINILSYHHPNKGLTKVAVSGFTKSYNFTDGLIHASDKGMIKTDDLVAVYFTEGEDYQFLRLEGTDAEKVRVCEVVSNDDGTETLIIGLKYEHYEEGQKTKGRSSTSLCFLSI